MQVHAVRDDLYCRAFRLQGSADDAGVTMVIRSHGVKGMRHVRGAGCEGGRGVLVARIAVTQRYRHFSL